MTDTKLQTSEKKLDLRGYFDNKAVKKRFEEVLGSRARAYIISILSLAGNTKLAECDPATVVNAAMIAALLDLSTNPSIGQAYIIPYGDQATFQIGWRGLVELAIRSGQFETINVTEVREGEVKNFDRLSGKMDFSWAETNRQNLPIVGYVAYFKLLNGFWKMLYMTKQETEKHATRYSKAYTSQYSKTNIWKDDFDAMSKKTVLKLLLSRFAPKSVQMQRAIISDQAIIHGEDNYEYIDNKPVSAEKVAEDKERTRIVNYITSVETLAELKAVESNIDPEDKELTDLYEVKARELQAKDKLP